MIRAILRAAFLSLALAAWVSLCWAATYPAPYPINWAATYWKTKQSHGGNVIFSTAGPGYVVLTDAGYLAFLAAGSGVQTASLTAVSIAATALTATIASGTPANGDVLVGGGVSANSQLSSVSIVGSALTATVSVSQAVGPVAMTTTAAKAIDDGVLAAALAGVGNQPGATVLAVNPTVWTGVSQLNEAATALFAGCVLTYSGDSSLNATYETGNGNPDYQYAKDIGLFTNYDASFPNSWSTITYQARSGPITLDSQAHLNGIVNGLLNYRTAWYNFYQNAGLAPTWGVCANGPETQIFNSPTLVDPIDEGFVVSTSTLTKTSNTTLATVPGLSIALTASKTYNCHGHLTGAADAGGGLKAALVASNSLSATSASFTGLLWNGTTPVANTTVTALGSNIAANTAAYTDLYIDGAIVVNAAGTINVQAAENASDATPTTVLVNSTFSCTRVN